MTIFLSPRVWAAVTTQPRELIADYILALHSQDETRIIQASQNLIQDPQAVAILRSRYPREYLMVRVQALQINLEDSVKEYQDKLTAIRRKLKESLAYPAALAGTPTDPRNQDNGDIAAIRSRIFPRDNREIALSYPNQDRRSNQEIIDSRKERLFNRDRD